MFVELKGWKIPAAETNPAKNAILLRKRIDPFIREYRDKREENKLTPKMIDRTWQAFWRVLGNIVGCEYKVPRCNLTEEKIRELENGKKAVLLLPHDIFTAEGLERLVKVITINWTGELKDLKEMKRISHGSNRGGCTNVEMQLSTPYTPDGGRNELELRELFDSKRRHGQRLPVYMVGSLFSQLIDGYPFDKIETCSRLIGSSYYDGKEYKTLVATYNNSNGCIDVFTCDSGHRGTNIGARSELVIEKSSLYIPRLR